jgi:hypothetical protein
VRIKYAGRMSATLAAIGAIALGVSVALPAHAATTTINPSQYGLPYGKAISNQLTLCPWTGTIYGVRVSIRCPNPTVYLGSRSVYSKLGSAWNTGEIAATKVTYRSNNISIPRTHNYAYITSTAGLGGKVRCDDGWHGQGIVDFYTRTVVKLIDAKTGKVLAAGRTEGPDTCEPGQRVSSLNIEAGIPKSVNISADYYLNGRTHAITGNMVGGIDSRGAGAFKVKPSSLKYGQKVYIVADHYLMQSVSSNGSLEATFTYAATGKFSAKFW